MGRITLLAVAHRWQCDHMGHLNARYYAHMFDDAGFQFLAMVDNARAQPQLGWADVHVETEFQNETLAGMLLTVTTELIRVGRSSIKYRHVLTCSQTGQVQAVAQVVTVRLDLLERKSIELDDG